MKKYYITDALRSKEFQQHLLKENTLQLGSQVLPFNAVFYKAEIESNIDTLRRFEKVQELNLKELKDIISYPAFFQQFDQFAKELALYNFSIDDLPLDSQYDIDIKSILASLSTPIETPNADVIYLEDTITHAQKVYLEHIEATPFDITTLEATTVEFKSALNFRQELEGAIQYIINHQIEPVTLVVPNLNEAWPLIQTMFNRYHIPYQSNQSAWISQYQYSTFIKYLMNPNTDDFLELIRSNFLSLKNQDMLLQYIDHFRLQLGDFLNPFDMAIENDSLKEIQELLQLQKAIQDDVFIMQEFLTTLNQQDLETNLIYGLKFLDSQSSTTIFNYIQTVIQYINHDNLPMVYHTLKNLNNTPQIQGTISITDFKHLPVNPVDTMIVLGLTAKHFPNINPKNGILDESYVSRIPGFPAQEERNAFELNKLKKIFSKSKHLILSYHIMNYEGKSQECAFEVINYTQKHNIQHNAWHIQEPNPFMDEKRMLDEEAAHRLHLRNNTLHASVSSLELYARSPFDYFMERGLKISPPFDFKLDARVVGTISHDVLEKFINGEEENLFALWDVYRPYFPVNYPYLSYLIKNNEKILTEQMVFLKHALEHTKFQPYQQELRISDDSLFKGIHFTGFVDRIDTYKDAFIVIDYKSSPHTITESQVLKGERLQLPIYALALEKLLEKKLFGFYYFSFNKKTTAPTFPRHVKTKGYVDMVDVDQLKYMKTFEFKGWTFEDPEHYQMPSEYFSGLLYSAKDDVVTVRSGAYDIEKLKPIIQEIVQYLRTCILDGILEVDEIELPLTSSYNFKEEKA